MSKSKTKPHHRLQQIGATTVEYALILAMLVAMVVSASSVMRKPLETFFAASVDRVSLWMGSSSLAGGIITAGETIAAGVGDSGEVGSADISSGTDIPAALASQDRRTERRDAESRERASRIDRRTDRQIQSDERWRREAGGDGSGHLSNDWAGRTILENYLVGSGDINVNNDPRWAEYMQANTLLTSDLENRALANAQQLFNSRKSPIVINETYTAEIENGEGVVGYQYLHGTNASAGGFERDGIATIAKNSAGGYEVKLSMSYTWNDVIDPNPQYSTDQWKNVVAETITLGQAEAYEIHINWTETTIITLDASGKPISIKNQ